MIQITPQMRILVAIEAVDGRKGIDSLARLCQEKLQADPFSGCLFVFRSRRGTSIRILVYDGQGFWLAQKRLSKGRFVWWPTGQEPVRRLQAHQAQLLLAAGNPETAAAPDVAKGELKKIEQNTCVLILSVACCGYGGNVALPRARDRQRTDRLSAGVHSDASHQQPLETIAAVMRSPGLETDQRHPARHSLPRPAADVGAGRPDRITAGALSDPRPVPDPAPAAGSGPDRYYAAGDAASGVGFD